MHRKRLHYGILHLFIAFFSVQLLISCNSISQFLLVSSCVIAVLFRKPLPLCSSVSSRGWGLWSTLIFVWVRNRNLVSFCNMWISSFQHTIFWSSYIFCNVYFWYLCWKSCGSCINSRSSEKHISLSYKSHNVVYTPMCNKCNVHMYVVWSGSRVHGTEIRTISWEIGQCFVLRRWLLVGFSIASEEMLLLLGRRWTKKVVLVNYQ